MNPTITINDRANTIAGRSIVDDRAICPQAHEQLPYGDFLLHDMGTGGGIVQGGPPDTITKLRTPSGDCAPRPVSCNDLKSESLAGAIRRHRGEAGGVSEKFREELSPTEQPQLITFLNSL